MNSWETIKEDLAHKISVEGFKNWVEPTAYRRMELETLFVAVPSEENRQWLEEEYNDAIQGVIRERQMPITRVCYEITGHGGANGSGNGFHTDSGLDYLTNFEMQTPAKQLNAKFTFDSFVVGACNQFAHAAAKAVASMPGRSYNPLFIYGGVGMGKTHLMHAIGRALIENFGGMRIIYTSSERFMNEMINCIRLERMSHFHQYYRSADILLVDDIQILGKKERTQEEFFHTFNTLHNHQKQIVISSDSSPKEIPGLVERLRSRFEWGLMADIQPPDLETKMAILDKKAAENGVKLPEDVRIFMATKTKSNVRELEGALVKLIAYSSMMGAEINLAMAQQTLRHLVHRPDRKITIESIVRAVAERFNMTPANLKQKSNAREVTYPRQIAMYLAKELTASSLPEIGRAFGGKHHTTVIHSIQKVEQQRQKDTDLNRVINSLIDSMH
jgi:chromosomal replication initiator protein